MIIENDIELKYAQNMINHLKHAMRGRVTPFAEHYIMWVEAVRKYEGIYKPIDAPKTKKVTKNKKTKIKK